jgi:hypothetical protein
MKRSTLILLLVAIGAAVAVYYLEFKPGKPRDEAKDESRPAFNFKAEDLIALAINRAGQKIRLERRDGRWRLTEPVDAPADASVLEALASDLAAARVERQIVSAPEELDKYGLVNPGLDLEIRLKSGQTHRLQFGGKDFSGGSVYARVDGSKEVALLPSALLASADKPLNDLRDRSLLTGLTPAEIASLDLNNSHGSLKLAREKASWELRSPVTAPADEAGVSDLLETLASAKGAEVVSEKGEDPSKYGLDRPQISVTARATGGPERSLAIGARTEGKETSYFARSSDHPQILKVEASLIEKLNIKPIDLRSKQIAGLNRDELTEVHLQNPNLTLIAERKTDGKWLVREPADRKEKEVLSGKLFDPFDLTKATEIIDQPSPAVLSKLNSPAVVARYSGKDGKVTTIKVSNADGESVYAQVEGRPEIYKAPKSLLDELSFKAEEIAP